MRDVGHRASAGQWENCFIRHSSLNQLLLLGIVIFLNEPFFVKLAVLNALDSVGKVRELDACARSAVPVSLVCFLESLA